MRRRRKQGNPHRQQPEPQRKPRKDSHTEGTALTPSPHRVHRTARKNPLGFFPGPSRNRPSLAGCAAGVKFLLPAPFPFAPAALLATRRAFCMSRPHLSNVLSLSGAFAFAVSVAFVVALHRVCIRTLMSRMGLDSVPVGVREESRCCHLSDGLKGPKRRRSHWNAVSMQRWALCSLLVERHIRLLCCP